MTIIGPAAGLTISGNNLSRVFQVDPGVTASFSGLTIASGNAYDANGGGLDNLGTARLTNCTVSGSSAGGNGGGMYNLGTATLTNCIISGNSAINNGGIDVVNHGGGVDNLGTATLINCIISGNSAVNNGGDGVETNGGGVYNAGTATLTNCTISGNSAVSTIHIYDYSYTYSAQVSGGGLVNAGTVTSGNTIVAGNTVVSGPDVSAAVTPDVSGAFISQGHNLIGKTDGSTGWVASDLTGTVASSLDPELVPEATPSGLIVPLGLFAGSPALDAGDTALVPAGVTTDVLGNPRIVNGTVDIGAIEAQTTIAPSFVVNTSDEVNFFNDTTSLREAILCANAFPGHTITFDPTVFATAQTITLTLGQLELSDTAGPTTITGPTAGLTISGNNLSRVFQVDPGVTADISNLTITHGSELQNSGSGGGVWNAGTLTLTNCILSNSHAFSEGGDVYNIGTLTVSDCKVFNSSAQSGGAVYNAGTVSVAETSFTSSGSQGGGVYNGYSGTATLTDCSFLSCQAVGAGVYNAGDATITGCTMSYGTGDSFGGGVYNANTGAIQMTDCTISGNLAKADGLYGEAEGGGVYNAGTATLTNCTIAGNSTYAQNGISAVGGGLFNNGTATLNNCVIAYNATNGTQAPGIFGSVTMNHSITGADVSDGTWIIPSDGPDPQLMPLGNYGGPTQTMPPKAGSLAIDAGSNALLPADLTTDQRGGTRIVNGTVDIGAVEIQPPLTVVTNPVNATIYVGQTATFTAQTNALPGLTSVQWQISTNGGTTFSNISNGGIITGVTTMTLSVTPLATAASGREFRAVFTSLDNPTNTVTSTAGIITVLASTVSITINPSSQSVPAGSTVTFTAAANAAPSATVQWQVSTDGGVSFTNIAGAINTTYSFTATAEDNGNQYRGVFTNTAKPSVTATTTAATLTVVPIIFITSTADDGSAGTLRWALNRVNAQPPGGFAITFAIPQSDPGYNASTGTWTINLSSALPAITANNVSINGLSQGGSGNTTPLVELNGSGAGSGSDGLLLGASGCTVSGLLIENFSANGIEVAASNNTIGGTATGAGNVLSGNSNDGLLIDSAASGVAVQGNYIGLDAIGTSNVGNGGNGVEIDGNNNTVGGDLFGVGLGAGNAISGNGHDGVFIHSGSGNRVLGNYVGTNAVGTSAVGNSHDGIAIIGSSNTIGSSTDANSRNIISGNAGAGVALLSGSNNVLENNFIGTNYNGSSALGNSVGVAVAASANTIGGTSPLVRNVISGNSGDGVWIESGVSGTVLQGNYIGSNFGDTSAVADGHGVEVSGSNNTLGGSVAAAGNFIAGNNGDGIRIDSGVSGVSVQGNLIDTDFHGEVAVGNSIGIEVAGSNNTLGGTNYYARNIISGNTGDGVLLDSSASGTLVQGNWIGTDFSGKTALGNQTGLEIASSGNTLGGTSYYTHNVLSGNHNDGVLLDNTASGNLVLGNRIGTDITTSIVLGNSNNGIEIQGSGNTIGGSYAAASNIIANNGAHGILVSSGSGNAMRCNSLYANGSAQSGPGIVVAGGANNSLVTPTILSATYVGNLLTVQCTITQPIANVKYVVEFFASPAGDPEGKVFLGQETANSTAGKHTFIFKLVTTVPMTNPVITATLTDPSGDTTAFSNGVTS
jgi:hypothetical protein